MALTLSSRALARCPALARRAATVQQSRGALTTRAFKEEEKKPAEQKGDIAHKGKGQQGLTSARRPSGAELAPFRRMTDAVNAIQREMESMMMNPFGSPFSMLDALASDMLPAPAGRFSRMIPIEVEEDDKQYTVKAEVPGFTKKDIKVTLDPMNATLTISGEKEGKEKEGGMMMSSHMNFTRTFTLPPDVDVEKAVSAKTEHGVLTLCLPKSPAKAQPHVKEIPVE